MDRVVERQFKAVGPARLLRHWGGWTAEDTRRWHAYGRPGVYVSSGGLADLSFLEQLEGISHVVLAGPSEDDQVLESCRSLTQLQLGPGQRPFDVSQLTALRELVVDRGRTVTGLERVESLRCYHGRWGADSLAAMGFHPQLEALTVYAPRLNDLAALANSVRLHTLIVRENDALASLESLPELPVLDHLELYACRALRRLDGVRLARRLTSVELHDCPSLASIGPLGELAGLGCLMLVGHTDVADGRIRFLAGRRTLEVLEVSPLRPHYDVVEADLGVRL